MEIIASGNTELIDLINNVLNYTVGKFKLSKFVCVYKYSNDNNIRIILFNTFTRKIISLSKEEYEMLESSINTQQISDIVIQLIKELMIINEDLDENQLYDDVRKAFMLENHQEFKGNEIFVIFTTTICNARCFYCFERNTKHITMDEYTAKQVANYIIRSRNPDKSVCLHWFGGEPLCNSLAIDTICTCLKYNNVAYTSRFTTNASMFDTSIAKKAVEEWNTDRIQVTLDGTESEHNRRKNYANPKEYNFKKTINNIEMLANMSINITVRINCDVNNIEDVNELVDYLREKFSGYKNIFIDPHPIFNCDNNESISQINKDFYDKMVMLEEKTSKYNIDNNEEVKKNSKNAFEKFRLGSCQSVSMRISPDGKLYPCQHIDQVSSYGNVVDGIIDTQMYNRWKAENHNNKCIRCKYRPLCACLEFCNANRDKCEEYANIKYRKWVFELCTSYYNMYEYVKLIGNFHIHNILNNIVAIGVYDNREENIKTVIKMNEISFFMWEYIKSGITKKELVQRILEKYDTSDSIAEISVCRFIGYLNSKGLLESSRLDSNL